MEGAFKELLEKYKAVSLQRVHLMAWITAMLKTEKDPIKSMSDLKRQLLVLLADMIDKEHMVKDKIDLEVAEVAKTVSEQEMMLEMFKENKKESDE